MLMVSSTKFLIGRFMRLDTHRRQSTAFRRPLAIVLLGLLASASVGCNPRLPEPSSKAYTDYVSAFYVGLAALQVGDDVRAERELAHTTQIVPGEPAAWANWGVLALRQRNFDPARQRLDRARALAPTNDAI